MPNHTTYTDELAEFVIDGLWQGKTMPQLEEENPVINRRTVSRWRKARPEFDAEYQAAMTGGAWALVDEIIPILDAIEADKDAASRKARAWGRLEVAKRKAPGELGDRQSIEHSGTIQTMSDEEVEAKYAALRAKLGDSGDASGDDHDG